MEVEKLSLFACTAQREKEGFPSSTNLVHIQTPPSFSDPESQRSKRENPNKNPAMDSPQTRKAGLNLPAGMSETSLRLDGISSSLRGISSLSSPSKSSTCSDRFIPCRSSSRLHTFGLTEKDSPVKEGGNEAYSRLLKSELFGPDFGCFSPAGGGNQVASPMSPSMNMLRFKTDHSGPSSPYSPSILGHDSTLSSESSTPPKPPRKVPKTPHKVIGSVLISLEQKCLKKETSLATS